MNLIINHSSMQPIYEQIIGQIKEKIMHGELQEDTMLPSVRTLAKELHYSHTAIANYESGRNEPSLSDLCRLSDILGVSTDALLGRNSVQHKAMTNPFLEKFMQLKPIMLLIIVVLFFFL